METNFSPIENYPFLSPFIFTENPEELEVHKEALLKQLEEVWRPLAITPVNLWNILLPVKKCLRE